MGAGAPAFAINEHSLLARVLHVLQRDPWMSWKRGSESTSLCPGAAASPNDRVIVRGLRVLW
jgi:hypothetical protein